MWTFFALVTAVVALVIAQRALNEVRALRASLDAHRRGAGGTAAGAAAPHGQPPQPPPPEPQPRPQVAPEPDRGAGAPPAVPPAPSRPEPEPEPVIPIWQPPPPAAPEPVPEPVAAFEATPPPPPPPPRPPAPRKPSFWQQVDWESFVGVKLFSWVAGVAMVIAAIYFLKYSVEHGWISPPIRAAIGLITGSAM